MSNHWLDQNIEKHRPLLTLLTDKINEWGYMMGAHRNRNWRNNTTYDTPYLDTPVERVQGTFDRIGSVEYHRSFHTKDSRDWFNPTYMGEDLYDHHIRLVWKELFGPGQADTPDILKNSMKQDSAGNWHYPCDEAMIISLWHPSQQSFQEKVHGCWLKHPSPHWRPIYNYTREDVVAALKIMCKEFDWEFKDTSRSWKELQERKSKWLFSMTDKDLSQ